MTKQEAIEKIEKLKGLTIKEKNLTLDIEMIPKGDVLEIIEQIDEPEKPVKMKLFGYEVEKDKLYTVEIPNPNAGGHVVLCKTSDGIVSITFVSIARWRGIKNVQLTEAEIKKDFEWAFRWAKEVEE